VAVGWGRGFVRRDPVLADRCWRVASGEGRMARFVQRESVLADR
jgi:hypothetical protein